MDVNKDRFQARLARISTGSQWVPDGVIVTRRAAQVMKQRGSSGKLGMGELIRVPLAFALGLAAVLGARLFFFHDVGSWLGEVPEQVNAALVWTGPLGMACILLGSFALMFKMTRGLRPYALLSGFFLMLHGENLVIAQAPDIFVRLYSPDYVAMATAALHTI